MRYVEYFVAIIIAFVSFSAYLLQLTGLPTPSRTLAFIFSTFSGVVSFFLSVVGFFIFRASLYTRVSQLQTAIYIDKLRNYLSSICEKHVVKYAKLVSFVYEEWYNTRVPANQLLILLIFLTSVPLGIFSYSIARLAIILWSPDKPLGIDWPLQAYIYPEHIIGFVLGIIVTGFSFFLLLRYLKNTLNTKYRYSMNELRKLENSKSNADI